MSTKETFKQLHQHAETWGFLYNINELPKKKELIKHCTDLQLALTVCSDADIEGAPLCDKLISIRKFVKNLKHPMPLNVLNVIKRFNMKDLGFLKDFINHASFCR
jgi:hypothetical protein